MANLSVQPDILFSLERAFEEGTLEDYIADYVGYTGSVVDIYDAVKESSIIEESDIDRAVKNLRQKELLTEPTDPYSELMEIYESIKNEDPLLIQETINATYFRHMGDKSWDEAYSKFISKAKSGSLIESVRKQLKMKKSKLTEAFDEARSMQIGDILADIADNMSDEQLESELKRFKKVASKLGIKDYNKMIMTIVEDDYDPRGTESIFEDAYVFETVMGSTYKYYPSVNMMAENNSNGLTYLYFTSIEDAIKYYNTIDQFWRDFEVENSTDMNYVNTDANVDEFEEDSDTINVEESLNLRDRKNNNKYDLLNKYLSEKYTMEEKLNIVKMLKESVSDEEIYNYMQELHNDEEAIKNFYGIDDDDIEDDEDLRMWKDMSEEDLRRAGAFDNLHDDEEVDDNFDWFRGRE